jgi:general stress protein YciG
MTSARSGSSETSSKRSSAPTKGSAAGQKNVSQDQVGSGKQNDPNNFAKNPERAAAAGRKGGKQGHG